MTTAERIVLTSPFLDTVRNLDFSETQYAEIVAALKTLAEEWKQKDTIDKRIACELFILPSVVRGSALRMGATAIGTQLANAAEELESLVSECLMPE